MLLWSTLAVCNFLCVFGQKFVSRVIGENKNSRAAGFYILIQSAISCLVFFLSGGGSLAVNLFTLGFCAVYAVLAVAAVRMELLIYAYYPVANVNITGGIGSLLLTTLFACLLLGEKLTVHAALKCVFMMASVALVFAGERVKSAPSRGRLWMLLIMPVINAAAGLMTKAYVNSPLSAGNASYGFYINAFMIAFCGGYMLLSRYIHSEKTAAEPFRFGWRELAATAARVIPSNIGTLVSLAILAKTDVILMNPITSAMALLFSIAVSLLYREKLKWNSYAAMVCGIAVLFV